MLPEQYKAQCLELAIQHDTLSNIRESLADAIAATAFGINMEDLIGRAAKGEFEHLKTHQPMKKGTVSSEIAGRAAYVDAIQGNKKEQDLITGELLIRLFKQAEIFKQIRSLDIKHKIETGSFFLPQEMRIKIAALLLEADDLNDNSQQSPNHITG